MYEKMAKKRFYGKRYKFETNEDFKFKIWYNTFQTVFHVVLGLQVCIFWTEREITRQKALPPYRVGPGRASTSRIMVIWSKVRKKWFHKQYKKKSIVSEFLRCFDLQYICGKKLSNEIAPLRLQLFHCISSVMQEHIYLALFKNK